MFQKHDKQAVEMMDSATPMQKQILIDGVCLPLLLFPLLRHRSTTSKSGCVVHMLVLHLIKKTPDGGARRALSRRDGAVPTRSRLPGASGGGGGQEGVKARPADSQLMGP